jgi:hypothetical protein
MRRHRPLLILLLLGVALAIIIPLWPTHQPPAPAIRPAYIDGPPIKLTHGECPALGLVGRDCINVAR